MDIVSLSGCQWLGLRRVEAWQVERFAQKYKPGLGQFGKVFPEVLRALVRCWLRCMLLRQIG